MVLKSVYRIIGRRNKGCSYEDGGYKDPLKVMGQRHQVQKEFVCEDFDSKWISYPLAVKEIKKAEIEYRGFGHRVGAPVKIRPCGEEYGKKTYFGIYLGELPQQLGASYSKSTGILEVNTFNNPAILVPEIGKIIFGSESFWSEITSEEEFRKITDEDINNQWYMKFLKIMGGDGQA